MAHLESDAAKKQESKLVWMEVAILLLLAALPTWVYDAFGIVPEYNGPIVDELSRIALNLPGCLLALYMMARSRKSWDHFGLNRNWNFMGVLTFFLGLFTVGLVLGWLAEVMRNAFTPKELPWIVAPISAEHWLVLWPSLLIGAAYEELIFRGFVTARLYDVTGSKWLAILVPSLVFGSIHWYQGLINAISITVYGALFSLMFLEWRRLKALILAHFALNVWIFSGFLK